MSEDISFSIENADDATACFIEEREAQIDSPARRRAAKDAVGDGSSLTYHATPATHFTFSPDILSIAHELYILVAVTTRDGLQRSHGFDFHGHSSVPRAATMPPMASDARYVSKEAFLPRRHAGEIDAAEG